MSAFLYASLTRRRVEASSGMSEDTQPPGIKTAMDALAALVPAELLGLHAVALALFTQTTDDGADQTLFTITERTNLQVAYAIIIALAFLLYALGIRGKWRRADAIRILIPPAAFVGWTMIQDNTAFDAFFDWHSSMRFFIPAVLAVLLGALAARLAQKADQE